MAADVATGLVSLLVAAVVLTTSAPAGAQIATGRQKVADANSGYAFSLPSGWHTVPLTKNRISSALSEAKKLSPALRRALTSEVQSATTSGIKLFAFSANAVHGFVPNLNIGVYDDIATTDQLLATAKQQLTQIGGKDVTVNLVRFAHITAVEATYELLLKGGQDVYGTQVYATHDAKTYVITFTAGSASIESSAAAQSMSTWHYIT